MIIQFDEAFDDVTAPSDQSAFVHETVTSAEIVYVLGSVDLATVDALEKMFVNAVTPGRPLVVDLSDCDYIGAAGFAALIRAHKRCGGQFAICIPKSGIPALLFALLSDQSPLRVEHSIDRAICAAVPRRIEFATDQN